MKGCFPQLRYGETDVPDFFETHVWAEWIFFQLFLDSGKNKKT